MMIAMPEVEMVSIAAMAEEGGLGPRRRGSVRGQWAEAAQPPQRRHGSRTGDDGEVDIEPQPGPGLGPDRPGSGSGGRIRIRLRPALGGAMGQGGPGTPYEGAAVILPGSTTEGVETGGGGRGVSPDEATARNDDGGEGGDLRGLVLLPPAARRSGRVRRRKLPPTGHVGGDVAWGIEEGEDDGDQGPRGASTGAAGANAASDAAGPAMPPGPALRIRIPLKRPQPPADP